jgi:AraC-like DNA-binding protein
VNEFNPPTFSEQNCPPSLLLFPADPRRPGCFFASSVLFIIPGNVFRVALITLSMSPKLTLKKYHLDMLSAAHDIINNHPLRHTTIEDMAISLGTNRKMLVSGFKQRYGTGIHQMQTKLVMEQARLLLLDTDKPIKDIVRMMGYKGSAGFRKAFRKEFGISPSDCRNYMRA